MKFFRNIQEAVQNPPYLFSRLEKIAEAERTKLILEAEAESESIRLKGEAEAFAIEAKAKAEAERMLKKAEAMKEYKEAAIIDMVLDCLPKVRSSKSIFFWLFY